MKKFLVSMAFALSALVIIGVVLMATRPDREAHKEALKSVASAVVNAEMDQSGIEETIASIGTMLGISAIDVYLSTNLVVRDHTFYNVGTINYEGLPRMVSVGLFNHVFTISEEDARQLLKDKSIF